MRNVVMAQRKRDRAVRGREEREREGAEEKKKATWESTRETHTERKDGTENRAESKK